jgi:hypothetical protein
MEKRWLLRLPKDLDDWLTMRAAAETVSRGKRISKNTLIIELASAAKHAEPSDQEPDSTQKESWENAKSALDFIQKTIELKTEEGSPVSDRVRQRMLVNLKLLGSYIEDLEE